MLNKSVTKHKKLKESGRREKQGMAKKAGQLNWPVKCKYRENGEMPDCLFQFTLPHFFPLFHQDSHKNVKWFSCYEMGMSL